AAYRNVIGINSVHRLRVGIDIRDIATVVDVLTANAANTYDITRGRDIEARVFARARVATSRVIVPEGIVTNSCVRESTGVDRERANPRARIVAAVRVVNKRLIANSCVLRAFGITGKRKSTKRGVLIAGGFAAVT